ncbi:MAG: DUF1822 family protein, partial [Desulfobacteraceae bacterium]|nr:DUF1822 family protein [Desulfobacteraceae bacterium]
MDIFKNILSEAKKIYKTARPGAHCPLDEILFDYVHDDLSQDEYQNISEHIKNCNYCSAMTLKIEADRTAWEYMFDQNPDKALADAIGPSGLKYLELVEAESGILPTDILDNLKKWFQNLFEQWQFPELATTCSYRGSGEKEGSIRRARIMDTGTGDLLMIVQLTPGQEENVTVILKIYPSGEGFYLPTDLQVEILQNGKLFMTDKTEDKNDSMELGWIRESGEQYSIRLTSGDFSV